MILTTEKNNFEIHSSCRSREAIIFSTLIGLFPLLSVYKSPIPAVDAGTFLLILFLFLTLKFRLEYSELGLLITYVFALMVLTLLDGELLVSKVLYISRNLKFLISLCIVFQLGYRTLFFKEEFAFKIIRAIIYINTLFILLQTIMYRFGIIINNPLYIFATNDAYIQNTLEYSDALYLYRPSGIFFEPSHYSEYAVVYLIYSSFKTKNARDVIVTLLGICCTGSGIGLYVSFVTLLLILTVYSTKNVHNFIISLFGVCALNVFFQFILQDIFFQKSLFRIFTDNTEGGGNAFLGRVSSYSFFFDRNIIDLVFGSGFGNVPSDIYLNGLSYLGYGIGIVGFLIFLCTLVKCFFYTDNWRKVLLVLFFTIVSVAQVFTAGFIVFFFCIIKSNTSSPKYTYNQRDVKTQHLMNPSLEK